MFPASESSHRYSIKAQGLEICNPHCQPQADVVVVHLNPAVIRFAAAIAVVAVFEFGLGIEAGVWDVVVGRAAADAGWWTDRNSVDGERISATRRVMGWVIRWVFLIFIYVLAVVAAAVGFVI
jgi:hypothetical protein